MSSKENNFKEQFKQALLSTARVISEDYKKNFDKKNKNVNEKKIDFLDISNLSNKNDFIKLRAEADSNALKKRFSNTKILFTIIIFVKIHTYKYRNKIKRKDVKQRKHNQHRYQGVASGRKGAKAGAVRLAVPKVAEASQ